MKYLSVCSGIEAASCAWEPLGFTPVGFSEIEAFPSAVLAHRFPSVKNYGDMTKYKEWNIEPGTIDILVGGTPCQSFSIAGLRKGLADPRGNLMLTFGAIADHYKPTWIVWENVPGVLSTNGGEDFRSFLDMLEYIGYVVDVDIHDAQFHGVPQRRRRVFICGRRSEDILNKRTNTSSLIIIQLLQEISRTILTVALHQSGNAPQSSDKLNRLNDGLGRRMKLFGLVGEKDNSTMLQENLIGVFLKHLQELKSSDVSRGEYEKALIQEGRLTDSQTVSPCTLTAQSLSEVLGESLKVAKSYITSTATKTITTSEIYLFSKLVLLTGKLIVLSNKSSPSLWSAASSSLTSLREYINYARQTTSDLFGDLERIHYWDDFIGEAVRLQEFIGNIGVEDFGKVLPITESMCGYPAPSRETGKGIAFNAQGSASQSLSVGEITPTLDRSKTPAVCFEPRSPDGCARLVGDITPTLNRMGGGQREPCIFTPVVIATGQGNAEITEGHAPTLNCNHAAPILSYGIPGNWIGRKPENGGNATEPMHDVAPCLTKTDRHGVAEQSAVRRLTPRECERLQGFQDDWTLIPWRGKPADECPDGNRYKACGNSMAVPVMRWIGERIKKQEELW